MGVEEIARQSARTSARASARDYQVPEPHERYELRPEEFPPGMDLMWLPTKIAGMPNDKVAQYYRAHWQPAKAEDFPRLSGYGTDYPQAMIEAGLLDNVRADAPVIIDDQMLVMRPKELSRRAAKARANDADNQVANQMARLQQSYRNARGVGVQRGKFGKLPDMAPQADDE